MHLLISADELNLLKSRDKIPLKCEHCLKTFYRTRNRVQVALNNTCGITLNYCSCYCNMQSKKTVMSYVCKQCGNEMLRRPKQVSKHKNAFCSLSCSAKYHNSHKTTGTRRSKLEAWIESELTKKYPTLVIDYNKTSAVNAELDIYIPSLKLAFELNGIFHYEPIYGPDKLQKTQSNDKRKFQACLERGIELCFLDTSHQKYFKEKTSRKYFDIINDIINQKIGGR
jgi:DNA-binding XRE family transcriptional regulator